MWLSLCRCEDRCPEGKHGEECLSECRCQNGGTCNPTSGKCYCTPGWTVSFRLQACTIVVILWIIILVFIEIWVFKKLCGNLPFIKGSILCTYSYAVRDCRCSVKCWNRFIGCMFFLVCKVLVVFFVLCYIYLRYFDVEERQEGRERSIMKGQLGK